MHAVGMATLLPLLVAVAMISGAFGFFSAIALRKEPTEAHVFAFGFFCGAAAAAIYDVRRQVCAPAAPHDRASH